MGIIGNKDSGMSMGYRGSARRLKISRKPLVGPSRACKGWGSAIMGPSYVYFFNNITEAYGWTFTLPE
jgi:hypothetical protein